LEILFQCRLGRGRKNWSKFHVLVDLLKIANEKGVSKLQVQGDSNLVIELLKVYFRMKKITLRSLLEHILVVVGLFEYIQFHHVQIEYNQDTNKLWKIGLNDQIGLLRVEEHTERNPATPKFYSLTICNISSTNLNLLFSFSWMMKVSS